MNLREFQREFGAELRRTAEPEVRLPVDEHGLERTQRLRIYRNNVRSVHERALAMVYPVVQRIVGKDFFSFLGDRYWFEIGSDSGNIQDYGAKLDGFLRSFAPVATLPYLADVAKLEWLRQEAGVAVQLSPTVMPAGDSLSAAQQHGDQSGVVHPSVRLIASKYPIVTIWNFCQSDDPEGEIRYDGPGQCVCVNRAPDGQIHMQCLNLGEYELLRWLIGGEAAFHAADQTAVDDEQPDLPAVLYRWFRDGIVVA